MVKQQEKTTSKAKLNKQIALYVTRAQKGDTEAFGEVYNLLLTPIYRYIYFKVSPDVAEDLTEEVFFKAWQNLRSYKKLGGFPFSAWLFRIAHNAVVDYYRTHQPIEELPEDITETRALMQPSVIVEESLNYEMLYRGLKHLSGVVEQAIILRFINGLHYKEIAKIMNKTEGAIRVMIHRGLGQLKDILVK